jgi:hypothetical protein
MVVFIFGTLMARSPQMGICSGNSSPLWRRVQTHPRNVGLNLAAGTEGVLIRCMQNDHSKAINVMIFVLYFTNPLTFSTGIFYNAT